MIETKNEPFSWGFEVGFLRSPVNPRMLLLNRKPEIDHSEGRYEPNDASAWSLISIADDLLRIGLSTVLTKQCKTHGTRGTRASTAPARSMVLALAYAQRGTSLASTAKLDSADCVVVTSATSSVALSFAA